MSNSTLKAAALILISTWVSWRQTILKLADYQLLFLPPHARGRAGTKPGSSWFTNGRSDHQAADRLSHLEMRCWRLFFRKLWHLMKKASGLRTNIAGLNVLSLCWPKEWLYLLERIGPSFKGGCFFNFIWGPLSIVATFCIPPPHSTLLFESCYKSYVELPEEQCSIGLSNRLQVKSCKDQLQLFPYDYFWGEAKVDRKKMENLPI